MKTISMYDGQDEKGNKWSIISAGMNDGTDLDIAAYDSAADMESEYNRLINAISSNLPIFIFGDEAVIEHDPFKENEEETPRYKNRFIDKR